MLGISHIDGLSMLFRSNPSFVHCPRGPVFFRPSFAFFSFPFLPLLSSPFLSIPFLFSLYENYRGVKSERTRFKQGRHFLLHAGNCCVYCCRFRTSFEIADNTIGKSGPPKWTFFSFRGNLQGNNLQSGQNTRIYYRCSRTY